MELIRINQRSIEMTDEGFLSNFSDWDQQIAEILAARAEIELTAAHWEIILLMRDYYQQFKLLPNSRLFVKAVAHQLGTDKGNSRYLQRLFPPSPLKYVCQIAGLAKPPSCL